MTWGSDIDLRNGFLCWYLLEMKIVSNYLIRDCRIREGNLGNETFLDFWRQKSVFSFGSQFFTNEMKAQPGTFHPSNPYYFSGTWAVEGSSEWPTPFSFHDLKCCFNMEGSRYCPLSGSGRFWWAWSLVPGKQTWLCILVLSQAGTATLLPVYRPQFLHKAGIEPKAQLPIGQWDEVKGEKWNSLAEGCLELIMNTFPFVMIVMAWIIPTHRPFPSPLLLHSSQILVVSLYFLTDVLFSRANSAKALKHPHVTGMGLGIFLLLASVMKDEAVIPSASGKGP